MAQKQIPELGLTPVNVSDRIQSNLSIKDLDTLLAVAETGSFRKAAIQLNIGQPSVSRRIRRLEDNLGLSLFERRTNGARVTEAGACFSQSVCEILNDLKWAIIAAQKRGVARAGRLRIGIIASLSQGALRNLLQEFMADRSGVEISIKELNRSQLFVLLSHRKIDVVVAAGLPQDEHGDGLVLRREPVFVALPDHHQMLTKSQLCWEDIAKETFIVSTRDHGPETHDYIVRGSSDFCRSAHIRQFEMGRDGIMNLVGMGMGVSLVADHCCGVRYPGVRFLPMSQPGERIPISLTWRPENDNPALRRFISLARIEAKRNGALS